MLSVTLNENESLRTVVILSIFKIFILQILYTNNKSWRPRRRLNLAIFISTMKNSKLTSTEQNPEIWNGFEIALNYGWTIIFE